MASLMIALALMSAPSQVGTEPAALEQLERVYQQSCAERAYGSYNDMCDQMRRQIRVYQRTLTAKTRTAKVGPPTAGAASPAAQVIGQPAGPATSYDGERTASPSPP